MNLLSIGITQFFYGFFSIIVYLVLAFVVQKVVFLESHTRRQFMTYLKLIGIAILVLIITIVIYYITPQRVYFDGFQIVLFGFAFFIPFFYSAYTGRKRCKWLALLEFIPVCGCIDGMMEIFKVFQRLLPFASSSSFIYFYSGPVILLSVIGCVAWLKPSFVRILVKDIRSRSLTVAEEIIVWLVGTWLAIYVAFVHAEIESSTSFYIQTYVSLLNFVSGGIIIAYVINSNYRDHYYKRNIHLQKSLITAMADLVENRDANTGGHIQRTSLYVEIIARKLQREGKFTDILTNKYIEDMVVAAPLHDVGKIHIPDAILNKPGKLEADEFAIMKTHSAAGGAIISHIEATTGDISYLHIAKEMAEYHHERMDGRGYPHGLSGNDIPLCARILAVADVFDAVSSKRCYKDAFSLEKSFAIIEEESGTHFDRDVAQAFLDSREEVEASLAQITLGIHGSMATGAGS